MAYYKAGTVAATNGSATIQGAGVDWINNQVMNQAIVFGDGRIYEIVSVDAKDRLTIAPAFTGVTGSGLSYFIVPVQGFPQAAAVGLSNVLAQINGYVTGPLAGRFGDGSTAAPGISFAADQDTGLRRVGDNSLSLVTGGADRAVFGTDSASVTGKFGVGTTSPASTMEVKSASGAAPTAGIRLSQSDGGRSWQLQAGAPGISNDYFSIYDVRAGAVRALIDDAGNLLAGVPTGGSHEIAKNVMSNAGNVVFVVSSNGEACAVFRAVGSGTLGSSANTALSLNRDNSTGRSINAAGTFNGSGADYAEYMTKAVGCGLIAKGDVAGVDRDGLLTDQWAEAISFVVKSTDPSLVGGDTWDSHLVRPVEPTLARLAYDDPAAEAARQAAHQAAMQAYQTDLAAWAVEHEAAREKVDRIAFCGQVPVNVTGPVEPGDYLVAAQDGDRIKAVAVKAADMTLALYMQRLGRVLTIRDGRPWVDVQHG